MKYVKRGKPPEIKNLKKAAERIKKACLPAGRAIKNKEKIVLYGDADLDGISSVIILKETIKTLGGNVADIYFPDREKEGYGLNESALQFLSKLSPALLVVVDCGIGNFKEIELAKKLGFETIVIDHHEILDKLPQASIVVDPKQKGDKYSFREFATVGIIFKLSRLLLAKKMTRALEKNFLELTALATIADMMPQEGENREFIVKGLKDIDKSWRPGLKAFFEMEPFQSCGNVYQQVSKIISILNVRDVKNSLPANYRVLTTPSVEVAKKLIVLFLEKSFERKEKIEKMLIEAEEKIQGTKEPIVFCGDEKWDLTLLSPIASIICRQYQKPTFIYKIEKTQIQGAVRTPKGMDGVKAMLSCPKLFETYGGHPQAAGFRIKSENLEKLRKCLIKYFKTKK